jgi:hypothetical protein
MIGLNFTDAKRNSMREGLFDYLKSYQEMRKVHLDNSIPPAVLFNLIPVGLKIDSKQKSLRFSDYKTIKMPENPEDLAYYPIGKLSYLIKNKKISSLHLTQMYLERLKKYSPKLECVITMIEDMALKQARQAD